MILASLCVTLRALIHLGRSPVSHVAAISSDCKLTDAQVEVPSDGVAA